MKVILESGPRYFPTDRTTVRSGRTGQTIGTIDSVDPAAKQDIGELYATAREMSLKYAGTIVPKSIAKSALAARGFVEGDVYFEASNKAREILLRAIIGEAAFDFPFITK